MELLLQMEKTAANLTNTDTGAGAVARPTHRGKAAESNGRLAAQESAKIETSYDAEKDKTTQSNSAPMQVSGEQGNYRSLHMSPSFGYPGVQTVTPEIVDFELQTVVKGRLRTDLYVVFIIDGEKVHLSSSRWRSNAPCPAAFGWVSASSFACLTRCS